jgi:hypothetical protein
MEELNYLGKLDNKVALITGWRRGLGKARAQKRFIPSFK